MINIPLYEDGPDMDIVEKIPVIITLTNILKKTGLDEKLYL